MPQISSPLFRTDGLESLQVSDVYKLTDAIPVNKLFEAAKDIGGKLFDAAGGRQGLVNGVARLISLQNTQQTGKEKLQSLLQVFGSSTSSLLQTGTSGILDKAGEYVGMDPSLVSKVKVTIGDVTRSYATSDASTLNELLGLAGNMAGAYGLEDTVKLINLGMEASVWGATISSAFQNNSYEIAKYYSSSLDADVKRLALMYASSTVMSSGDLDNLITVLSETTADTLLAQNANFIKVFLSAFTKATTWTANDYATKGQLLFDTLARIDANWWRFNRNGVWIPELDPFNTMSADGRELLALVTDVKVTDMATPLDKFTGAIQIAADFPEDSAENICKAYYPLSVASLK